MRFSNGHASLPRPRIAGYAVALGTPVLSQTVLAVKDHGGDFAALSYGALPANQPNTYENWVYLWNATAVPFGRPPPLSPDQKAIASKAQSGTTVMTGIDIAHSSYIFGYAVGPGSTSLVCASVVLDAGGQTSSATSVTIGIRYIGTSPSPCAIGHVRALPIFMQALLVVSLTAGGTFALRR